MNDQNNEITPDLENIIKSYENCLATAKVLPISSYTLKDVEEFSKKLSNYTNETGFSQFTGQFLFDFLINNIIKEGQEIKLDLSNVGYNVNDIALNLDKGIVGIKAAFSNNIGNNMSGGKLYLFGRHGKLSNTIGPNAEVYEVNEKYWDEKDITKVRKKLIWPVNEQSLLRKIGNIPKDIIEKYNSALTYGK